MTNTYSRKQSDEQICAGSVNAAIQTPNIAMSTNTSCVLSRLVPYIQRFGKFLIARRTSMLQRIRGYLTSMDQGSLSMDTRLSIAPVPRSWASSTGLMEDKVHDSGSVSMDPGPHP